VLVFAALFKAGVRAWVQPQRFTARRLWGIGLAALIATYAGALGSFSGQLRALVAAGEPWYRAVVRVARLATPLQIMVLIGALLMLAAISTARREYLQRALDQARAEHERDAAAAQLTQARLSLLQAQIQPHFLFNTLAALQHWVDVGDARAAPLLRALTGFLRGSTELMLRDGVTLAQEGELVRHYLAIMQSRLGERLRFRIDLAPGCEAQPLPPGLLITLVENAVEHGIEPQLRGGEVQVIARQVDGVFELRVLDDGAGLAAGPGGVAEGVGLTNSRERLRHQFGPRAELLLRARTDSPGTEVRLRVHP
jgi:sensor histidine kinase YesM